VESITYIHVIGKWLGLDSGFLNDTDGQVQKGDVAAIDDATAATKRSANNTRPSGSEATKSQQQPTTTIGKEYKE
jgi:hypothetical protein